MSLDEGRAYVRPVLLVGLTLIAVVAAVTLSRSPPVVASENSVPPSTVVAKTNGDSILCQRGERVPSGTIAVRLWVHTNISPEVHVVVRSGSRVITKGGQEPGRLTETIAIPVARVTSAITDASTCFEFGPAVETVLLLGEQVSEPRAGEAPFRVRVEYLRAGHATWWDMASLVARRIGLGRAPSGSWVVLLPLVLMAVASLLAVRLVLRQVGGAPSGASRLDIAGKRVPAPAWICASIACLSAASWSILTPPFQVPDEPSHFAYVQQLAEARSLPTSSEASFSEDEEVALRDLHHLEVRFAPAIGTISTAAQQQRLERDLARRPARRGRGGAGVALPEPPLYYALETIPYFLGSSGTLLDQLALMRLFSALMAGLVALFAFLFLREALPRIPWVWSVGALATAMTPLVGFMSGAVNPDSMLCAVSAALFYLLARAFRRGVTPWLAFAVGVALTIGLLTKLNFLGLLPGTGVAMIILARRAARNSKRIAYQSLALALAGPAVTTCVYITINLFSHHAALGLLSSGLKNTTRRGSIAAEISYVWQFYLPRLPGMMRDFPGILTTRQIWLDRLVGMYGWLDTYFPNWVYQVALVPTGAIVALCGRAMFVERGALRARVGETLCYLLIVGGVLALVGADAYLSFPASGGGYAEPRYLLPTVVLFAAVLALAARGAGERWGRAVGAVIVLSVLAHDIFSQLLVVGRYYG